MTIMGIARVGMFILKYIGWHRHRGISWLAEHTKQARKFEPVPIGFYFTRLWYYEELYPVFLPWERWKKFFQNINRQAGQCLLFGLE